MKFGVFLPTFLFPGTGPEHAAQVRAFARHAEELGFDSLWITDHIVTAYQFYAVSWLDSLMTLSHVAAVTERVKLGTSIIILPVRQPAVLAKEIATLHHLSGGATSTASAPAGTGPSSRRAASTRASAAPAPTRCWRRRMRCCAGPTSITPGATTS